MVTIAPTNSRRPRASTRANKAVKSALNKYKQPPRKPAAKYAVHNNKNAIMTLSRQVKALQVAKLGKFQKEYHYCKIGEGASNLRLTDAQPVLFALNDFTENAPVYIGSRDTTVIPNVNSYTTGTVWSDATPFGGSSGNDDYSYWRVDNANKADKSGYTPISTRVKINFEMVNVTPAEEFWFRVDIIKPTKVLLNSNVHKLTLPTNVQGLAKLASSDLDVRNRINRTYFTVYDTKWFKMSHNNEVNKTLEKFYSINFKFPKQKSVENMAATDDMTIGTTTIPQNFITNVPQDDIYWCLISTSNTQSDRRSKIQMTRYISYRDNDNK